MATTSGTNYWYSGWFNNTSTTSATNFTLSWKEVPGDGWLVSNVSNVSRKCFRCRHEFTSHRAGRTTCYFKGCKCDLFTETEDMPEGLI